MHRASPVLPLSHVTTTPTPTGHSQSVRPQWICYEMCFSVPLFVFFFSSSEIKVWADQTPLSVPRASAIVLKVYSFDKLEPAFTVWLRFTQELNNAV